MNENKLSTLLKAVSDATRRSLLTVLCQQGRTRVTDLARIYDLSLNAVSKHIKVLEKAGLVRRETIGRTHWIAAELTQITAIEDWFKSLKSIWALRLDNFNELMTGGDKNNE
ncbi:arsenical resistance operon repressor [bacterium MnTg03]|nr:arsenical resistance operon repressor [bacterium MnTg03]